MFIYVVVVSQIRGQHSRLSCPLLSLRAVRALPFFFQSREDSRALSSLVESRSVYNLPGATLYQTVWTVCVPYYCSRYHTFYGDTIKYKWSLHFETEWNINILVPQYTGNPGNALRQYSSSTASTYSTRTRAQPHNLSLYFGTERYTAVCLYVIAWARQGLLIRNVLSDRCPPRARTPPKQQRMPSHNIYTTLVASVISYDTFDVHTYQSQNGNYVPVWAFAMCRTGRHKTLLCKTRVVVWSIPTSNLNLARRPRQTRPQTQP